MVAESYQIGFPESSLPAKTPKAGTKERVPKTPTKDGPRYYTLAEGTTLWTGPLGGTGEFIGHVEKTARAHVLRKIIIDGMVSFFVEVESPPEQKGRYWVTKRFGRGRGFL